MSTDADRTPTDQKVILADVTPTDTKVVVEGSFMAEASEADYDIDSGPPTYQDPNSGPPTLQRAAVDRERTDPKESASQSHEVTTVRERPVAPDDGTPTDQKIVVDVTPTDKQLLSGSMAVGRGTILDARWRTERCLASGGYGDVWQGVDMVEKRDVAVKILRTDAGNNDPSAIARMRQEAEILKAISHPNIVAVHGFGESPYGHFLVMEMLDGKAIDQLLTIEGPVDAERAIPLVQQLLEALSVAHDQQVFHRDLKPENIIIVKDGNTEVAKLVDFGIAKATRLLNDDDEEGATLVQTRAGGFMGTPRYAAPEQAVGDPCGPNIDLFALGLVIAEWLTGQQRINGERHGDVMQQLLSPDELDISDVPYRWREWLALMVRKNPRQRLQTAQQALAELDRLVVKLHKKPDFLDNDNSRSTTNRPASAFAANDGPLELDFDRARKPRHTPHPPAPAGAQFAAPANARSNMAPKMMRRVAEPTAHVPQSAQLPQQQSHRNSAGYQLSKMVFVIAVAAISFAAFALIIMFLGRYLES